MIGESRAMSVSHFLGHAPRNSHTAAEKGITVSDSGDGRLELAQLISTLRTELELAQALAPEKSRLVVKDIHLEVSFTFTKEAGVKGGVKFWVCEAGAEGKLASEHVQKVTLCLEPKPGETLEVGHDVDARPF